MVDDDNPPAGDSDPESEGAIFSAPSGPRRSTWSPSVATDVNTAIDMSDDDLARALEEDFERATHTGVLPIVNPFAQALLPDEPRHTVPEPAVSEPVVVHALDDVPLRDEYIHSTQSGPTLVDRDPWAEMNVQPETASVLPEAPTPQFEPSETAEPAAEVTDERPVRRSIPTSELAATLSQQPESGEPPVDFMTQLEDQLRLREQDVSEFLRWQESKVAEGSSESLAEVESVRANFGDILDNPPAATPSSTAPEVGPELATHTFRVDEVLDSDLLSAPAPMTAPVSDIPPPTDSATGSFSLPGSFALPDPVAPLPPGNPTPIPSPSSAVPSMAVPSTPIPPFSAPSTVPDLIEPSIAASASGPFDFDALIGGEASVAEEAPTGFSFNDAVERDAVGDDVVEPVLDTDHVVADLIGPFPVTSEGVAMIPAAPVAPFAPVPSPSLSISGEPLAQAKLTAPPAFKVEEFSTEPTPTVQRVGRASRLFWLWFAANSSIVSVAFGGAVLSLGMSLRQAIVATLIGVAVSFLPLGLGTLAGKWSGQPTMIVSRATFGHLGNVLPSVLAIIVRVFWGAVLLWFLAAGTARVLVGAELAGPLTETQVMIIGLAVGFLLALVIAFFGYGLIARVQMVFTIISAGLIVGLIVITWPAVNVRMALTVGDGPWILVVTGSVLVFSFVGLVWAVSSADLARYQRASGSGAASMLWSTFGATIPAFVLISYGAVLAASDPKVATGLVETPLDTIALLIPLWYPVPLVAALAFSLLSGVVISIYSGGFALQATGASMRRPAAVVIVGAGVAVLAGVLAFTVGDFSLILRDVATTLAVPIAAWAGIFGAEMMIRSKRFSPHALLHRGGVYADFHWVNVAMLLIASAVGFGLTTASVAWLSWQGYLFSVLGVPLSSDLAESDLGVFVALIIGILTPIIVGIPGIRRQEVKAINQAQTAAH